MSLAQFRSQFNGGAKPTLYKVTGKFPDGTDSSGTAALKMSFDAKTAQLPGSSVGLISVPYKGRIVKLAGDRDFQPMTLTIINDTDWTIRTAFERWMNLINGHAENIGATRPDQYQTDFTIEQLDRNGIAIATYTLIGCYPSDISAIELGYEQVDTIEDFTVTLEMQYWQRGEAGIL